MFKKVLKRLVLFLLIIFAIAQFFSPDLNNGDLSTIEPFIKETKASPKVVAILKESCLDCHSNHTRYPWYNSITPVNYWLADHIDHGKKHFNVSEWNDLPPKKKKHKLEEVIGEVKKGHMPLPSYLKTHSEAQLTDAQKEIIINWTQNAMNAY